MSSYQIVVFALCNLLSCATCWRVSSLRHFKPQFETNSTSFVLEKYLAVQKLLFEEVHGKFRYPVVSNINSYLRHMSGDRNCFIVVDNFQNINLLESTFPLILRFPATFIIQEIFLVNHISYRIIFGPGNKLHTNISSQEDFPCPTLFAQVVKRDYCFSVNLTKFSLFSKPSTCYIHLGIFPPTFITHFKHFFVYPNFYYFKFTDLHKHEHTPPSVLVINAMIIPNCDKASDPWTLTKLRRWATSTQNSSP